jgi:hypothetical protein
VSEHDPAAEQPPPNDPDFVRWSYLGPESVFFYQPGSLEEHLVTEHGIPSLDVRRQARGSYDHGGDHRKQFAVGAGAIGDLIVTDHRHDHDREHAA